MIYLIQVICSVGALELDRAKLEVSEINNLKEDLSFCVLPIEGHCFYRILSHAGSRSTSNLLWNYLELELIEEAELRLE